MFKTQFFSHVFRILSFQTTYQPFEVAQLALMNLIIVEIIRS